MKKLNILIILHWMIPDGSGIYYLRLAKMLKDRGHNIIVASTGGSLVGKLENHGIKHYKVPTYLNLPKHLKNSPLHQLRYIFYLLRLLWLTKKENIDIIHSHSLAATCFAFACSKITRTPFIIHVGSPTSADLPPSIFRRIHPFVEKVIVISKESMDYITKNSKNSNIGKEKIIIIPNLVNMEEFRQPASLDEIYECECKYNINHDKKKIVLVSRLDADKENPIISTINAASKIIQEVSNIQIIIVGDGDIYHKIYKLSEEVNQKQKEKIILMTGYVNDVAEIMKSADIVVAIGQTAIEAMACGRPVIVAGHKTGPLGGSFGGIITKDNIEEIKNYNLTGRNSSEIVTSTRIAEAAIKLLKDKDYRDAFGSFNQQIAEDEYSLEKNIEKIERVYLNALEK